MIWADRRWRLRHGRAFALYVALYTFGRFWIESLRVDDAHKFLGLRINDWTSIVVFIGAVAYFVLRRNVDGRHAGSDVSDDEAPGDNEAPGDADRTLAT